MNLKNCPCCGKMQTTKNAEFKGRYELIHEMLMFNCTECKGTFVLISKDSRKNMDEYKDLKLKAREMLRKLAA